MKNLVSIITPTFNSSRYIEKCIVSVISQSYTNWELILVDDDSTDKTQQIITKYSRKYKKIKSIILNKNSGVANARNVAIQNSKGRFIAFLDSDDYWHKDKLSLQLDFMIKNNFAFTFTSYQPISNDEKKKYRIIHAPKKMNYDKYLKNTIIGCLTVVIDKEKTGKFLMPNINSSQDMALWLNLMKKGFVAYGLKLNLASYRIVKGSNTSNKFKAIKDVWFVYRQHENLNFIYSLWCFTFYVVNAIRKRI